MSLENPSTADSLYEARLDEVDSYRPVFSGDIFGVPEGEHEGSWIVLQHPCALRRDGVTLVDRLLVAPVVSPKNKLRTKMSDEAFALFPLRGMRGPGQDGVAEFISVTSVPSGVLTLDQRIAILSQQGVNLLFQRWVFHNSRVIIATERFNTASLAEYEEADLAAEWIEDSLDRGQSRIEAERTFHTWIREPASPEAGAEIRQRLLRTPASQPSVRKAMRAHLKSA